MLNKSCPYEEYGLVSSPPSPFQITQWNKQFRHKVKKVHENDINKENQQGNPERVRLG